MGPRSYVTEDDALEVAAGDAAIIEEDVVAMLSQVLENGQRPRNVGAAIAEKNGLLDALHILCYASGILWNYSTRLCESRATALNYAVVPSAHGPAAHPSR